jgi:hypothetical protein
MVAVAPLAPAANAAPWLTLGSAAAASYQLDQGSVKRDGALVSYTMRKDDRSGLRPGIIGAVSSSQINCATHERLSLSFELLHEDGTVDRTPSEHRWRPIAPHSVAANIERIVCASAG